MEKAKKTLGTMLIQLREVPFWLLLLLMIGLELFLRKPWSAVAPLALLLYWASANGKFISHQMHKCKCWLLILLSSQSDKSLWFENEGCKQIMEVVGRLTKEGKYYCNLADEIKLPSFEHWYAISKGLHKLGVTSQYTKNSFYISWRPNERDSGKV